MEIELAGSRVSSPQAVVNLTGMPNSVSPLSNCVLGFSDLQVDIAVELVRRGVHVAIFNQRSIAEIFFVHYHVAAVVGQGTQDLKRIAALQENLMAMQAAVTTRVAAGAHRREVFFL